MKPSLCEEFTSRVHSRLPLRAKVRRGERVWGGVKVTVPSLPSAGAFLPTQGCEQSPVGWAEEMCHCFSAIHTQATRPSRCDSQHISS